MAFNPKKSWGYIILLSEGEKIHHSTPKVIQMKLPCGRLAENDDENVSVFASHFKKCLNSNKSTDDTVFCDIELL